jgi:hypothetical protein
MTMGHLFPYGALYVQGSNRGKEVSYFPLQETGPRNGHCLGTSGNGWGMLTLYAVPMEAH